MPLMWKEYGVLWLLDGCHEQALICFQEAENKYQELYYQNQDFIVDNYVETINYLALTYFKMGYTKLSNLTFKKGWELYKKNLKKRQDCFVNISEMVNNWKFCWDTLEDPHRWANRISEHLRNQLDVIDMKRSPKYIHKLHELFTEFHVYWLQQCIKEQKYADIVAILSIMSGWRVALSVFDEIATIDVNTTHNLEEDLKELLNKYQEIRHQLNNLSHVSEALSKEDLKINADDWELYHSLINQRKQIIEELAKYPEYQGLLSQNKNFQAENFLKNLQNNDRMLIIFDQTIQINDHPSSVERLCEPTSLSGFLWLDPTQHTVQWFEIPTDIFNQLKNTFYSFNSLVKNIYQHTRLRCDNEILYHQPISANINKYNLWETLGNLIKENIWDKITDNFQTIENLYLVTQGNVAHLLPHQMNCPVERTRITRLPGLAFIAMQLGMLKRPQCLENDVRGIIYYKGKQNPLPFAIAEAEALNQLWQINVLMYDENNPQTFQQQVGNLYMIGHGDQTNIVIGNDKKLSSKEIRISRFKPHDLMLSCCLSGSTTDKFGNVYGSASEFLIKGSRFIACSTVVLVDSWASTVAIISNYLQKGKKLPLKRAHYEAQQLLKNGEWFDNHEMRMLVIGAWKIGFYQLLQDIIDDEFPKNKPKDMLQRRFASRVSENIFQQNVLSNNLTLDEIKVLTDPLSETVFLAKTQGYIDSKQLSIMYIDSWITDDIIRKVPEPLILGSFIHASWVFG